MQAEQIQAFSQADPDFATTLAKGMALLQAFGPCGGLLGNKTLAERTGLTKPTVTRLAKTLVQLGYLRYDTRESKYGLDAGLLELVHPFLRQWSIRRVARPLMQRMADEIHGAVSLGMARGLQMIFIESCIDNRSYSGRPEVGALRDIATTGMGRAWLASLDELARRRMYEEIRLTGRADWPDLRKRLDEEVQRFHEEGYCLSRGEDRRGLSAVGVAISVPGLQTPMAFSVVVPDLLLKPGQLERDIAPRAINLVHTVADGITND